MRSLFTAAVLAAATTATQVPTLNTAINREHLEAAKFKKCAAEVDFSDEHVMSRLAECQEHARALTTAAATCTPANTSKPGDYTLTSSFKKSADGKSLELDWLL